MKKRILMMLALASTLAISCSKEKTSFNMKGEVAHVADSLDVNVVISNFDKGTVDTLATGMVVGGKFELKGEIKSPDVAMVFIEGVRTPFQFILEPADIEIKGDIQDPRSVKITGSPQNDVMLEAEAKLKPYIDSLQSIQTAAMMLDPNDKESMRQYEIAYTNNMKGIEREAMAYCSDSKNSDKIVSAMFLVNLTQSKPIDSIKMIYNSFNDVVKNSSPGLYVKRFIDENTVSKDSPKIKDIKGLDPNGKEIALSDIDAKYILIDFWASWCGPCRKENPNIVRAYNDFKDKGFAILGISLDKDAGKWKDAIASDKLNWYNISDLKGWESKYAKEYKITGIPASFLIDKEGNIIAKNLRGEELHSKLAELLK